MAHILYCLVAFVVYSKRPPSTLVFQNVHVYYEQIHPNLLQSLSRLVMLAKLKCFVLCLVYNICQGTVTEYKAKLNLNSDNM